MPTIGRVVGGGAEESLDYPDQRAVRRESVGGEDQARAFDSRTGRKMWVRTPNLPPHFQAFHITNFGQIFSRC